MAEEIYLVEIVTYDTVGEQVSSLVGSTGSGMTTRPTETPANVTYEPIVREPGNYERHLYSSKRTSGPSETGRGVCTLVNADGRLDPYRAHAFDGRSLVVRKGPVGGAYPADFPVLFTGTADVPDWRWRLLTIPLRDRMRELVDKTFQETKFAGDNALPGGVEGVEGDLKGKPKPKLYGRALNFTPPCVNTSLLIFQISDGAIQSIDAVHDGNATLAAGVNRASVAALVASAPAADTYDWYSGADGTYIRTGNAVQLAITVDASEGANTAARTVAQIVKRILTGPAGLTNADLDLTSFTDLDTANSAEVGFWFGPSETKIGGALDVILASIGAWLNDDREGVFHVGRLEAPSGSPVATFEAWALIDRGEPIEIISTADPGEGLPVYRVNLEYALNHTVQQGADVAGIAEDRKGWLAQQYRSVTATDATIKTAYLLAPEMSVQSLILDATAAQTEADRLLALYGARRDMIRIRVPVDLARDVDLGDVVQVKVPRFGFDSGKNFRVLGIVEEYGKNVTTLELWG